MREREKGQRDDKGETEGERSKGEGERERKEREKEKILKTDSLRERGETGRQRGRIIE